VALAVVVAVVALLEALATLLQLLLRKAITAPQVKAASEAEVVAEQALLGQGVTEELAPIAPFRDLPLATQVVVPPTQQQDSETQQKAVAA
jgi:hypothetical protein